MKQGKTIRRNVAYTVFRYSSPLSLSGHTSL